MFRRSGVRASTTLSGRRFVFLRPTAEGSQEPAPRRRRAALEAPGAKAAAGATPSWMSARASQGFQKNRARERSAACSAAGFIPGGRCLPVQTHQDVDITRGFLSLTGNVQRPQVSAANPGTHRLSELERRPQILTFEVSRSPADAPFPPLRGSRTFSGLANRIAFIIKYYSAAVRDSIALSVSPSSARDAHAVDDDTSLCHRRGRLSIWCERILLFERLAILANLQYAAPSY